MSNNLPIYPETIYPSVEENLPIRLETTGSSEIQAYSQPFHPIVEYRDKFAPAYHQRANQLFDSMVSKAGIDVDANEVLNLRIDKIAGELSARTKFLNKLRAQRVFTILGAVAAGISPFIVNAIVQNQAQYLLPIGWVISIVAALGLTGLAAWGAVQLTEKIKPLRSQVEQDTAQKAEWISEGAAALAPMANTYQWNMLDPLTERTVPGLLLDPYVPSSREFDLFANYGLQQPIGPDSSVVNAQSGSYNGNPFVTLQTLNYQMGSKTYTGTLVITWVEMETYTDSNGRLRTRPVTRTQTLVAQVTKPFPTYFPDAIVVMGTEAAPELSFSREPSKLSALEGKKAERKVNRTVKKLEKQARNTTDGNNFTVTSNQDFDALFHAVNRNDEVQFRVLFTPAAQQQMVELMREKQHGYGDNFEFHKYGPIIIVRPKHLINNDLTAVPVPPSGSSEQYNLAHQRAGFTGRAAAQFRDQYHALAPMLAIPLLHEPRSTMAPEPSQVPAQWEAEAAANYRAFDFAPAESVTENILKVLPSVSNPNQFTVTSHGFRGVERLDFVPTLGGDGRIHAVPVPWVEYQPVSAMRPMHLWDSRTPAPAGAGQNPTFRRCLLSTP